MKAKIFIDQDAALKAGVNNFGGYVIEFDPADLTQAQRDELATCTFRDSVYDTNSLIGVNFKSAIPYPNLEALVSVIEARIAYKAKRAEEEKAKAKEAYQNRYNHLVKWVNNPDYNWVREIHMGYEVNIPYFDESN
ncbi:MAG: hypothetical protein WA151_14705 [Desulfatirhabdiaceae bacterium]